MKRLWSLLTICLLITQFVISRDSHAIAGQNFLQFLKRQFSSAVRGPYGPAAFVRSYEGEERAYVYDQSLAVLAFVHAGDQSAARRVLNALWNSQTPSGAWYFSYPIDDDRQIAGSIAWVVIAANAYRARFHDTEFDTMARSALDYLATQLKTVQYRGETGLAVRFSSKDLPSTPWNETQVISVEHNLDAFSAFRNFAGAGAARYQKFASAIRRFVESMWDGDHFHAGFNLETQKPNTEELYLDTQSWGVLALGTRGLRGENYAAGLRLECEEFSTRLTQGSGKDLLGFFDYRPARGLPGEPFIWSEGSLGVLLAYQEAASDLKTSDCEGRSTADRIWTTIDAMTGAGGGVAYATSNSRGFSTRASVAGTAWAYFARQKFNPFKPIRSGGTD